MDVYDSQKIIADISLVLSKLIMISTVRGKNPSLKADDLFTRFAIFLPLLLPNTMLWSICLVTLFLKLCPKSFRKPCKSVVTCSPIYLPSQPLFCRKSPFRHYVNTQLLFLKQFPMKTVDY